MISDDPVIEVSPKFQVFQDFILSQNIGDWKNYFELAHHGHLQSSRYRYICKQIKESIATDNLCNGLSRKLAWCVLLNISSDLLETSYRGLYLGLKQDLFKVNK